MELSDLVTRCEDLVEEPDDHCDHDNRCGHDNRCDHDSPCDHDNCCDHDNRCDNNHDYDLCWWKCCLPLNARKEEGDKEKDVWEVLREPERIEEASKNISL